MTEALTFNDVLIVPKFSSVRSRKEVDLTTKLGNKLTLKLPIISANMKTVTEELMASIMASLGGMGILHRFWSIERNLEAFRAIKTDLEARNVLCEYGPTVGVSIGLGSDEQYRASVLYQAGARIFCIDVAMGFNTQVVDQTKWVKENLKDVFLIVGNFATKENIVSFVNLLNPQEIPDMFKVGVGSGANCSTRLKTGCGLPQLTANMDCASSGYSIISDGGIQYPGDIAKALVSGAEAVMVGSLLASTTESPGLVSYSKNYPGGYKEHSGSASGGYGNGWKTSEGVSTIVPFKGPIEPILKDLEGGLRSALSYTGSFNLNEFKVNSKFVKITSNGVVENSTHILNKGASLNE